MGTPMLASPICHFFDVLLSQICLLGQVAEVMTRINNNLCHYMLFHDAKGLHSDTQQMKDGLDGHREHT